MLRRESTSRELEVLGWPDTGFFRVASRTYKDKKYLYYDSYRKEEEACKQASELRCRGYLVELFQQEARSVWSGKLHIEYELYIYTPCIGEE